MTEGGMVGRPKHQRRRRCLASAARQQWHPEWLPNHDFNL